MGRRTMAKNQEIFTQKLPAPKIVQWKGSKKTMYGRMGGGWAAVGSSWPLTPSLNGSYMPVTATHPHNTITYRTIHCTDLSHCKVTFWTLSSTDTDNSSTIRNNLFLAASCHVKASVLRYIVYGYRATCFSKAAPSHPFAALIILLLHLHARSGRSTILLKHLMINFWKPRLDFRFILKLGHFRQVFSCESCFCCQA